MKILQILIASSVLMGCASLEKLQPTTKQISIDGRSDDWPALTHFDKDAGLLFEVTYDESHLYVFAKYYEAATVQQIMESGLTVWISPDGKKTKSIGVKYPMIRSASLRDKKERKPDLKVEDKMEHKQNERLILYGINSVKPQVISKKDLTMDLDVSIGSDSTGKLLYEMKFPLNLIAHDFKVDIEKLAIGFEMDEFTRPRAQERPESASGNRGGGGRNGGGGRSGGGRSGGGGRSQGGSEQQTPGPPSSNENQTNLFWYQAKL
jgi:uncharacterized membrane protein YgcG